MLSSYTTRIPRELQQIEEVFKICANDPNSCDRLPNASAQNWVTFALVFVFICFFIAINNFISKLRKSDGTEYVMPGDFFIGLKDFGDWLDQKFLDKIKRKLNMNQQSQSYDNNNDENQGLNLEDQIEPIGGFYEPKSANVVELGQDAGAPQNVGQTNYQIDVNAAPAFGNGQVGVQPQMMNNGGV